MPSYYEFFAGGGMARAGLGPRWRPLYANDMDPKKAAGYAQNWGAEHMHCADIQTLTADRLPGHADLAWASFPCQDLSLAGAGAGLSGARSGTFWAFWSLMQALAETGRKPPLIVLENVTGALTSHGGRDFCALIDAFAAAGYAVGALVIDAALFLPQSRKRLFVIAYDRTRTIPDGLHGDRPQEHWTPQSLITAQGRLSAGSQAAWRWWLLPAPPPRKATLSDVILEDALDRLWHAPADTQRLLAMMSPRNRIKVEDASQGGDRLIGALYRRTRKTKNGDRIQRAEVRFDGLAGCLRTPAGGSSRQMLLIVEGARIRSRLLAAREAARLMGLSDNYQLPERYNDAYHLLGDGVAVPVVDALAQGLLEPLLATQAGRAAA